MPHFRKRPVVIEAVRWDGTNIEEVLALVDFDALKEIPNPPGPDGHGVGHSATGEITIPTLEGTMTGQPGDWIIKGVKGEIYPCKPDIFEATYEPFTPMEAEPGARPDPHMSLEQMAAETGAQIEGPDER